MCPGMESTGNGGQCADTENGFRISGLWCSDILLEHTGYSRDFIHLHGAPARASRYNDVHNDGPVFE